MKQSTEDLAQFAIRILAHIALHTAKNPVGSDTLEAAFGCKERKITQAVAYLRDHGHKIASSRGGYDEVLNCDIPAGFFLARNPEEISSTISMLKSNIKRQSERIAKLSDWRNMAADLWEREGVA